MRTERWGSLSVADHTDTDSLAANVLLYDRLVLPVMTEQVDRNERAYWMDRGWDPSLQTRRLEQLDELAIQRPWDRQRRLNFKSRMAEVLAEQGDAKRMVDAYGTTRQLLAQEQVVKLPKGVEHVDVVAAYSSGRSLRQDFRFAELSPNLSEQALLLRRRLAIPARTDPEDTLRAAIELSRDPGFRKKRADLFEWQAMMAALPPQAVVERISDLTQAYNDEVKRAAKTVRKRFAFTVSGIALGFATGSFIGAAALAALSIIQFAALDSSPTVEAGSARPVAMFHDIRERVGLKLR